MSNEAKGRIPHQRGELCAEAQKQWDRMRKMERSVRRWAYSRTGLPSTELDDIESKVWMAIYARLKNSGPLDKSPEAYLFRVAKQQAGAHLQELTERAEKFVGDRLYLLEHETAPGPEEQNLADLAPALKVLRGSLSDLQMKAFVLAEAYHLTAPKIAELLGGKTSKATVRDALRHARRKRSVLFGDLAGD
jgi:DNA-directed RNA polymerase specialized sigma24 family protein